MTKFYQRKLFAQAYEHLSSKQITVITGMRRTGKTTLIKHLLEKVESQNKIYIDLQLLNNQELFAEKNFNNIVKFWEKNGLDLKNRAYVGIDEIQLVPNIPGILKYLYDNYNIKFIVTGSSSYYLKNLFGESLAGRKHILELFPLDFGEFLEFKEIKIQSGNWIKSEFSPHNYNNLQNLYEEFIEYGGFPQVVLAIDIAEKKRLLNDIIGSYINTDIKLLSDFRNTSNINKLIKMLSLRAANRLDIAKISRLTGIARTTVNNYVDLFEKTYLITRVPVFTKNPDREIVKTQKLYFNDSGLLGILADVGSGARFENTIFNQLRQQGKLQYYSLKTGREIDFILDGKIALEVKETPTVLDNKELKELAQLAGLKELALIGRFSSPQFEKYIWGGEII